MPHSGAVLCLASAAAFGAMGVFGKLAYGEGATVGTLLATRFALAATVLWTVVAGTGRLRAIRALPRREVILALALGALAYGAQAGGYFTALTRLDASLLSLLVYTFPVMVTVAAIALGRERARPRTALALAVASTGLVLVLAAASILSTLEPVVTVALAFVAFGQTLDPAQLAGGALVLAAVLAVRIPHDPRRSRDEQHPTARREGRPRRGRDARRRSRHRRRARRGGSDRLVHRPQHP